MPCFLDSLQKRCPGATAHFFNELLTQAPKWQHFLIALILDSPENFLASQQEWTFKTLAQEAAESFARQSPIWTSFISDASLHGNFFHEAAKQYGTNLMLRVSDIRDGLRLYVRDGDAIIEGTPLNRDWQFLQGLVEHGFDVEPSIYEPPKWAKSLYLNRENVRIVEAISIDIDRLSPEDREHARELRRTAVRLYQDGSALSSVDATDNYPPELRAAIEGFHAVYGDPSAISGRTPKQALLKWLERNTELSKDARDRVATVANWLPKGGAPKTPSR